MRFRHQLALLFSAAVYILYLGARDQLDLYIHPRYINFTLTMSVIGALVIAYAYYNQSKKITKNNKKLTLKMQDIPLLFIVFVAIVLPARSLSSATVSQRVADSGSIASVGESNSSSLLFAGSSTGLRLADWARILSVNEDPTFYSNKPAKISGFVYDAGLGNDVVWLSRFVVTCCAVDAQPVGVPVFIEGWEGSYAEDDWLEAEGSFGSIDGADGGIVLIPDMLHEIDEPDNPYAN